MSEKSRLVKNTGLIAIGNFSAKVVSFLLLPLYTDILSTAEYGTYDNIVAISSFLLPIVTMSMSDAMFRFIIDTGSEGLEFKRMVSNSFTVILIGVSILALGLSGVYFAFKVDNLFFVWVYVTASAFYTFTNNLLRGMGKIKEYAIISSSKNIMAVIFNVLTIVVFRWGMVGLLFSLCVAEVISFIVVACKTRLWNQVSFNLVSGDKTKMMLKYAIPLIPNTLSATIINLSDRLIITRFMGPGANGVYSISYKFPNMVEVIYHFFYTAWSESASRVWAKGKEEATKYYQALYEQIDNLVFSVILLMTAGMAILFRIFVRGDYVQGFIYVPFLMFAMYFNCLAKYYSGLYTAMKKTKAMATSTIIAAMVNLVINFLLIKEIGLYAAAISTLVAEIILFLVRKKLISKEIYIQMNMKKVILEVLMIVMVISLYSYDNWIKIWIAVMVAGIYAVVMNRSVFETIYKMMKRKMKR